MARISTHVLNVSEGKPASGIAVRLYYARDLLASGVTNADGRIDLSEDSLETGRYELIFETGSQFFPEVSVKFQILDAGRNYHVPLLLSPYGYTTYLGS